MATEREQVQALFAQNVTPGKGPPTLEEFPMGGDFPGSVADYVRARPPLVDTTRPNLFDTVVGQKHPNAEFNRTYDDKLITGTQEMTVEQEFLESLIDEYQNDEFRRKKLETIHELPRDEQLRILDWEIQRRDFHKVSAREALLIQTLRSGYHDMTVAKFDQMKRNFSGSELDQFRMDLRRQQTADLRKEVDKVSARFQIGGNLGENLATVAYQDLAPITNVLTRIGYSLAGDVEPDKDIPWYKAIFPGEVRQARREWFANATPDQRIQFVKDLGDAIEQLQNGPMAPFITDYGLVENWAELFTDELVDENIPTNTLDRWLGSLDVVLESIYGIGLLAKLGGRGVRGAFRANNSVRARRVARTTGNNRLRQKLDQELQIVMRNAGGDPAESALVHLPRPPSLADDIEVLPDSLKEAVERGDRIRTEILANSDDLTGISLTVQDKVNVVRKELSEIDGADGMVVNPQMSVLRALPNDTGFKYTAVYGETSEHGWDNIADALDEAFALDPELEHFTVLRRNADGNLEEVTDLSARVQGVEVDEFGLNNLSDEELLTLSKQVDPEGDAFKTIEEEAMRRASGDREYVGDALRAYDGEEYFLRMDHERFWHTADKEALGPNTFRDTGIFPRWLLNPSQRFGTELFSSFDRAYRIEQQTIRRFEQIYKPYYDLAPSDKRFVEGAMDWMEQFAKENGRIPSIPEMYAHFDGMTDKQLGGILSLNQGLNVQWEMFNRRLYRDWHTQGYKTAKPVGNDSFPTFHGEQVPKERARSSQVFYDPVSQKQVQLTSDEIADLYDRGGGIMKLDLAIDIPGEAGKASTRVLVDPEHYKVGKLSTEVLEYHPGYFSRFYKDPFYIIKRTGKEVDGTRTDLVEDAIRTAGSVEEAERFVRRFATYNHSRGVWINNEDPTKTYRIQRAADLDQNESSLFSRQALHREGRLFWDRRNFDRLPDVNGNRADLEDPVRALSRSTVMATRQTTHEDLMKSLKMAFQREYEDILGPTFATDSISETITRLRKAKRSVAEVSLRGRYDEALELAKYIRLQQGTDGLLVPHMREATVRVAGWVSRLAGRANTPLISNPAFKLSRILENYGAQMDPLRAMRSVAFHSFMIFRPVRQLLLQGAQFSFLTGIDPLYIGTGRVVKDGMLLRSGLLNLSRSGYDDGISIAKKAKLMGLTQKQYKRLVNEFDRSGLLDTVDVHAFAGGARRPVKVEGSRAVGAAGRVRDAMQRYGFDTGEQLNLSFTYMIAMRRFMRKNKINDLMKLEKDQWDTIANEAQQLALGMTKPNKMAYQSDVWGNMTQFLSFGHKAALALVGQNPAISSSEAWRMVMAGYLMFGPNMLGASDWMREWSANKGIDRWMDKELKGFGGTLHDLLTLGAIQVGLNAIFRQTFEDHKDVDFSFFAPGPNSQMLWEQTFKTWAENPWGAAFGPFGNIAKGGLEGLDFIARMAQSPDSISLEDKVIRSSDQVLRGTLPLYNDVMTAHQAYKVNQWYSRAGRAIPVELEPVISAIIGRSALGARTVEELAYFQANREVWQTKENMRSVIEGNRDHLLRQLNLYYNGELSVEFLQDQLGMLMAWSEDWPEHLRMEILKQSLILENQQGESPLKMMAENAKFITPDIAALLDEMPGLPPEAREELETFLRELYEERSQNADQFINQDLQDAPIWQN